MIPDYYKIMGLSTDATSADVKRVFRTLAKKYHPDRNAHRSDWATTQMKRVLEANRTLSDAKRRDVYDRKRQVLPGHRPVRKTWMPYRDPNDPVVQAEGILEDLLGANQARAVMNYERLCAAGRFRLSDRLELRDWVDCAFLLGEEYEKRSLPRKALELYEEVQNSEPARTRYAHLVHQVREHLLRLYCKVLAPDSPPPEAAMYYLRALALELTGGQKAQLHKKLAECHLESGDAESARRHLEIAFRLKPALKGAAKICQKLAFEPRRAANA